jgi:hypothetical protein
VIPEDNIFDHFLCAFRKGHGCQTTLLRLLEDWKQALDCNEYIVSILMDLSKAFDCGFACMQLKLNQFMSILLSCCKTFTTSSKFGE